MFKNSTPPKYDIDKYGDYDKLWHPTDSTSVNVSGTIYYYFVDTASQQWIVKMKEPFKKVEAVANLEKNLRIMSITATPTHIWISRSLGDKQYLSRFDFNLTYIDSMDLKLLDAEYLIKLRYNEMNGYFYALTRATKYVLKFDSEFNSVVKMKLKDYPDCLAVYGDKIYVGAGANVFEIDKDLNEARNFTTLLRDDVNDLAFDSNGNMLYSSKNHGLYMFTVKKETFYYKMAAFVNSLRISVDNRIIISQAVKPSSTSPYITRIKIFF